MDEWSVDDLMGGHIDTKLLLFLLSSVLVNNNNKLQKVFQIHSITSYVMNKNANII